LAAERQFITHHLPIDPTPFSCYRQLSKDYEVLLEISNALMDFAMMRIMICRLASFDTSVGFSNILSTLKPLGSGVLCRLPAIYDRSFQLNRLKICLYCAGLT